MEDITWDCFIIKTWTFLKLWHEGKGIKKKRKKKQVFQGVPYWVNYSLICRDARTFSCSLQLFSDIKLLNSDICKPV